MVVIDIRITREMNIMVLFLQCTEISVCGNYGLVGYSSGHVDMYNIQSGLYRGTYGTDKGTYSSKHYIRHRIS